MLDPRKIAVSEIMTSDVLTLSADATVREALEALGDYGVSGAPVVDVVGRCVGVFSVTDVARREAEIAVGATPPTSGWYNLDEESDRLNQAEEIADAAESIDTETDFDFSREVVGDWMSRDVKAVSPYTTVAEAARVMADEGIHRVLVMEGQRIEGIVSTLDVVDMVARAGRPGGRRPKKRSRARSRAG